MAYIFKGRLCYVCDDCLKPLSRVKVRLYRLAKGRDVTTLAVAAPKDTFAILTDQEVADKEKLLIAESEADEAGRFSFELGDKEKYKGEAFEVDVFCATVPPHRKTTEDAKPVQFSVTTLQPFWRQRGDSLFYGWEYCLPARLWCLIRARFRDVRVPAVLADRHAPADDPDAVPNVKVRAFDVDWLQDD